MRLRINPAIANVKIGTFIERAEELQEALRNVGWIPYDDFERVGLDYRRWSADVESGLLTMFDGGDVLTAEWQAFQVGCTDEDESRLHNRQRLTSSANRGIEWLKDLRIRLTDIPQSPRTPQLSVHP